MLEDLFEGDEDLTVTSVTKQEPILPSVAANLEVVKYRGMQGIPTGADPMLFWHGKQDVFPMLVLMAKHHLCVPGSSVPSERIFSLAGVA